MVAAVDQMHVIAKAFIIDITATVENDQQVGVRKLTQAHACQVNGSSQSSQGSPALKEVGQVGDQTAGLGEEEGVS
jgi:hypothetical protein